MNRTISSMRLVKLVLYQQFELVLCWHRAMVFFCFSGPPSLILARVLSNTTFDPSLESVILQGILSSNFFYNCKDVCIKCLVSIWSHHHQFVNVHVQQGSCDCYIREYTSTPYVGCPIDILSKHFHPKFCIEKLQGILHIFILSTTAFKIFTL